jgi:ABC-type sugar transport system ATPase subunit
LFRDIVYIVKTLTKTNHIRDAIRTFYVLCPEDHEKVATMVDNAIAEGKSLVNTQSISKGLSSERKKSD